MLVCTLIDSIITERIADYYYPDLKTVKPIELYKIKFVTRW